MYLIVAYCPGWRKYCILQNERLEVNNKQLFVNNCIHSNFKAPHIWVQDKHILNTYP